MVEKSVSEKIGEFWSAHERNKSDKIQGWWDIGYINQRINQLVAGLDSPVKSAGINQLLLTRLNGRRLNTGVSVGCGDGSKEMRLLELGIVDKFILFDFAEERLKNGLALANERGLLDRVEFHGTDAFEFDFSGIPIELVHWNNSLHHMFDVYKAVKWSFDLLPPGGVFYMDDYVGHNRFQWPDFMLDIANEVGKMVPQMYSVNEKERLELSVLGRCNPDALADPSEAVDSQRILDAVRLYFPQAEIKKTGGLIYSLVIHPFRHKFNLDNPEHMETLKELMDIDQLYARHPQVPTLYATALAFKML